MILKRARAAARRICLLALVAMAIAAPAAAQKPTFDVEGVVTDAQQGVLPGATVTLQNVANGLARETATDANGRYADANGKFPDANGRYADANGRYPDANGRYPDASGNYPDAAGNYGASGSGAADPSAGADGQYTLDDMAALREKLMAMGIPPAEIDRIIARLEEKFGITDPAQTGIEPTATPTIGPIANTPDALMTPNSPVGGSPSAAGTPITGGASLSAAAIASNPAIGKYSKEISTASAITGMSPELLGAQMWAESRGNASTATTNGDGTTDWGLMQVGNERWKRDIVPGLSSTQRAAIEKATGKPAEQLDMRNPLDNIIGGAVHIQQYIDQNGGNLNAGLAAYVGRDSKYVGNVTTFMQELKDGKQLSNLAGA